MNIQSVSFAKKNRRGLVLINPLLKIRRRSNIKCVSELSYGHSGFTGTLAWADPETQIIYIFLSNRIHPNSDNKKLLDLNVRTDIMEQILNIMKDKLKIGIVCYPTYGGSGVVATELGIAFAEKGHEVHFISYDQPFRLELFSDKIYYHEVNIPSYPLFEYTPYELNLTSKLVDVTIHEKLDILHVHYAIRFSSCQC